MYFFYFLSYYTFYVTEQFLNIPVYSKLFFLKFSIFSKVISIKHVKSLSNFPEVF
jgi:hypothetical protein